MDSYFIDWYENNDKNQNVCINYDTNIQEWHASLTFCCSGQSVQGKSIPVSVRVIGSLSVGEGQSVCVSVSKSLGPCIGMLEAAVQFATRWWCIFLRKKRHPP